MRLLILASLSLAIAGCDGSGGNSTAQPPQADDPTTTPTTDGSGGNGEPVSEPVTPDVVPPTDGTPPPAAVPPSGMPDAPTPGAAGGDDLQVLLGDGVPTPGIADSLIADVDGYSVTDNGWLAAAARLETEGQSPDYAIFRGTVGGALAPVLRFEDSIGGYPTNVWFDKPASFTPIITEDSTIWMTVELGGAGQGDAVTI